MQVSEGMEEMNAFGRKKKKQTKKKTRETERESARGRERARKRQMEKSNIAEESNSSAGEG